MSQANVVGVRITSNVTHEQTHHVLLDHKALNRAIAGWIQDHLKIPTSGAGVSVNIHFDKETEGSPAYSVGTSAHVRITRDMRASPEDAAAVRA